MTTLKDDAWAMPVTELARRRDGVLAWMSEHSVDVIAVTDPESIVYLTGIDIGGRVRGKSLLLAEDGRHFFVTRSLERHWQPYWATRTWCVDWGFHEDVETLAQALARLATDLAGGAPRRLGLELSRPSLSFSDAQFLSSKAGQTVDATSCITELRRIKSEPELCAMRRAGEITMLGASAAVATLAAGGNGSDATSAAFAALIGAAGGQTPVSGPHVTSGARTAMAHSAWNHETPKSGDCAVLVMTGSCERYNAPIEWTLTKGEPDQERARILAACDLATTTVMEGLRPGMTAHDGDLLCRKVIEEAGLSEHFMNRAAYGIGLTFISWMESLVQLKPGDHSEIKPGMTLHIVPALHVPGHGFMLRSAAFEMTETGCRSLRPTPNFSSIF